jgi:glucose-6-phosphate isomerase
VSTSLLPRLHWKGAFAPGVSRDDVDGLTPRLKAGANVLSTGSRERLAGYGWIRLPYEDPAEILAAGAILSESDAIVQIGIGGSALGNLMLHSALLPPYWNELPTAVRRRPRFFMSDNPDPQDVETIWRLLDPARTDFIVVSKSGSTAETMANFLFFRGKMEETFGPGAASRRFVVITDRKQGCLRPFVDETGCRSLVLPSDVGGRFSVLSSVGLLSAATLGIDVRSLLAGAAAMADLVVSAETPEENPAWMISALSLLHAESGRNMNVVMPYADALERFVEWFAQLWGESLGKKGMGSTPVRALGAIDQHSQIQMYTEGPDDKLFTIVSVAEPARDIAIPSAPERSLEDIAYLFGSSLHTLLSYEARSTAAAILKAGKPVLFLEIPALGAFSLGSLVFLYEYATALTGILMEIDPFDQPGVEQGKRYIYGLMGKKGFGQEAEEALSLERRFRVS